VAAEACHTNAPPAHHLPASGRQVSGARGAAAAFNLLWAPVLPCWAAGSSGQWQWLAAPALAAMPGCYAPVNCKSLIYLLSFTTSVGDYYTLHTSPT
jgi:hypothetical protein